MSEYIVCLIMSSILFFGGLVILVIQSDFLLGKSYDWDAVERDLFSQDRQRVMGISQFVNKSGQCKGCKYSNIELNISTHRLQCLNCGMTDILWAMMEKDK